MVKNNSAVIVSPNKFEHCSYGIFWDLCKKICEDIDGAKLYEFPYPYVGFDNGSKLEFIKMNSEDDVHRRGGMQANYIGVDAIEGIDKDYIYFLHTRNRGIGDGGNILDVVSPPVVSSDSFVGQLIGWYLDEDGYPIEERLDRTMYFIPTHDGIVSNVHKEVLLKHDNIGYIPSVHISVPNSNTRISII